MEDRKDKSNFNKFESDVINLINEIHKEKINALNDIGLRVDIIGPKQTINTKGYTSEIEINFWDGNNLEDVLEFFIFYDGHQEATITEITEWLRDNFDDVILKYKKQ